MIAAPPLTPRERAVTPREMQILLMLDEEGATLKDVAAELGISVNTCRSHLRTSFQKLHVHRYHDALRAIGRGRVD